MYNDLDLYHHHCTTNSNSSKTTTTTTTTTTNNRKAQFMHISARYPSQGIEGTRSSQLQGEGWYRLFREGIFDILGGWVGTVPQKKSSGEGSYLKNEPILIRNAPKSVVFRWKIAKFSL